MQTTILNAIYKQYFEWHPRICTFWDRMLRDTSVLEHFFAEAGYHVPGVSEYELMSMPVDIQRISDAVMSILSTHSADEAEFEDMSAYEVALRLAGLLMVEQALPQVEALLLSVDIPKKCGSKTRMLAVDSFLMLESDLDHIIDVLSNAADAIPVFTDEEFDEYLPVMLVGHLLRRGSTEDVRRASEIIVTIDTRNGKRALLGRLCEIQRAGIDTSGWIDTVISEFGFCFSALPAIIEWIYALRSSDCFRRVLSNDVWGELRRMVICAAIENEDYRQAIHPTVVELRDELIDGDVEDEVRIAALVLLGYLGEDLEDLLSADDWVARCGAYLATAFRETPADYRSAMLSESDEEVKYAIRLAHLIRSPVAASWHEPKLASYYRDAGYGLRSVTRSLIAGLGREDILHEVRLESELCGPISFSRLEELAEEQMSPYWPRRFLLDRDFRMIPGSVDDPSEWFLRFNAAGIMARSKDPNLDLAIEEAFVATSDLEHARELMLLCAQRDIRLGAAGKTKAKVVQNEPRSLSSEEFRLLLPYVPFYDASLRESFFRSAESVTRSTPERLFELVRLLIASDAFSPSEIARFTYRLALSGPRATGEPVLEQLGTIHASCDSPKVFALAATFGANLAGYALNGLSSGTPLDSSSREVICAAAEQAETFLERHAVLMHVVRHSDAQGMTEWMHYRLSCGAFWEERVLFAELMGTKLDRTYIPMCVLLVNDDDEDVRERAAQAIRDILMHDPPNSTANFIVGTIDYEDEDAFEKMINELRKSVMDADRYRKYIDKKMIVRTVAPDETGIFAPTPTGGAIGKDIVSDVLLHLSVEFVDEETPQAVFRVVEEETLEAVRWLLEQGRCTFFTVQKS